MDSNLTLPLFILLLKLFRLCLLGAPFSLTSSHPLKKIQPFSDTISCSRPFPALTLESVISPRNPSSLILDNGA